MKHLLKKLEKGTQCTLCLQTWKTKPRKDNCPGVPIIDKKHSDYHNLAWKYWAIDSLKRQNLRPITKVCCIRENKEYIYFYDKKGETEFIDPTLPPVLDVSCCDCHDEAKNSAHCLKSELGLLKLNLVPGNAKPVAVCYSGFSPEFKPLYNPLDCEIALYNMPPPSRRNFYSWDKINRKNSDLLDNKKLKEFNLKPRANMVAVWAEWNTKQQNNWEFLWDIKQCEIDDTSLPPVYQEIPKHLRREDNLFKINKKVGKNTKPKGCVWEKYQQIFTFLYDPKECELINPDLPPIVKWSSGYSHPVCNKYCPSYLKDKLGLRKLNLTPGDNNPVAVYHNEVIFITLYNPLDCQVLDPNLPPIKQKLKDIPDDLIGDRELVKWNLKPRKNMKACCVCWKPNGGWEFFWDIKQCEIDDINLPPVIEKKPDHLYEQKDLAMLNRWVGKNSIASACLNHWGTGKFILLYNPKDCELSNPNLPPCYPQDAIPDGLKSEWGWRQAEPLFELKKDAIASGCFLKKTQQFLINNNGTVVRKPVLLYDRTQLKIHNREVFLSKTKLKQNYHLSPKLLELLGKPDKLEANPINKHYAPVQLYSRKRVEKFLADHAEIYLNHLAKRQTYLAIFEKNRDKLLSPKSRKKAQETKKLKQKVPIVLKQYKWDENNKKVALQSLQCLRCAYGVVGGSGFLCSVNPLGLDVDQLPCKDWEEKCSN